MNVALVLLGELATREIALHRAQSAGGQSVGSAPSMTLSMALAIRQIIRDHADSGSALIPCARCGGSSIGPDGDSYRCCSTCWRESFR